MQQSPMKGSALNLKRGKSQFKSPTKHDSWFYEEYDVDKQLGYGAYAKVFLAENCEGEEFAVKESKGRTSTSQAKTEFNFLRELWHPNIPKAMEFYANDDRSKSFLVMEYLEDYLELNEYVRDNGVL